MATRPKEIVNEPMERMAMRGTFGADFSADLSAGAGPRLELLSNFTSEGFRKALFRRENIMPPVPRSFQALQHIPQCELRRFRRLQLVPGERHGDRRPRDPPG